MRSNFSTCLLLATAVFILASAPACARGGAGTLDYIYAPNPARPAEAYPGSTVTFDISEAVHNSCSCRLVFYVVINGARKELSNVLRVSPDPASGTYRFNATLPADVKPGFYEIASHKGHNDDSSPRSLIVREAASSTLTIIHLADPEASESSLFFSTMPQDINKLKPDAVIISGKLTASSSPEDYMFFTKALDAFAAPTFVIPGKAVEAEAAPYIGRSGDTITFSGAAIVPYDASTPSGAKSALSQLKYSAPVILVNTSPGKSDASKVLKSISPAKADLILSGGGDGKKAPAGLAAAAPASGGNFTVIQIEKGKIKSARADKIK